MACSIAVGKSSASKNIPFGLLIQNLFHATSGQPIITIYFFASHNPVDVTKIEFGQIQEKQLPIKLYTEWVLEFENTGFKNLNTVVETTILL